MNVGELISLLSEMPAEAYVMFHGDEYYFSIGEVVLDSDGDAVIR